MTDSNDFRPFFPPDNGRFMNLSVYCFENGDFSGGLSYIKAVFGCVAESRSNTVIAEGSVAMASSVIDIGVIRSKLVAYYVSVSLDIH